MGDAVGSGNGGVHHGSNSHHGNASSSGNLGGSNQPRYHRPTYNKRKKSARRDSDGRAELRESHR